MFTFEKIDKNVQFNYLFLRIPKNVLYVRVGQVASLSEKKFDWKKSCLSKAASSLQSPL